jgi:hypothetical protein
VIPDWFGYQRDFMSERRPAYRQGSVVEGASERVATRTMISPMIEKYVDEAWFQR